jgi:hypothetical protein
MLWVLVAAAGDIDVAAHRRDVEGWQKGRDARLRAEGGWLSLAGWFG